MPGFYPYLLVEQVLHVPRPFCKDFRTLRGSSNYLILSNVKLWLIIPGGLLIKTWHWNQLTQRLSLTDATDWSRLETCLRWDQGPRVVFCGLVHGFLFQAWAFKNLDIPAQIVHDFTWINSLVTSLHVLVASSYPVTLVSQTHRAWLAQS